MRVTLTLLIFSVSVASFTQVNPDDIILIFNNVYPGGGDLYELEDVLAGDSIRTNVPGWKFISLRCSVILPGYTWESINYYRLSPDTKDKIRQACTTERRGPAGIASVYLSRITIANSAGDTIVIPERTLRIRRVSTYVEPEVKDTMLLFNNVMPEMVDGLFVYYRNDLMSEDTIRTNISGLQVVSFTSIVSCYPNFRDPNTFFLNDAARLLLKKCSKGSLKISDLILENQAGERFVISSQVIQYKAY